MSGEATLRDIAPSAFLPTLLFGIGQGAVVPVVALSALDLGASTGVASLVVALAGIGQLAGDIPAGQLASRFGERSTMLGAIGLLSVALVACVLASSVWVLGAAIVVTGLATAVWAVARQSYVTDVVPLHLRARALSTLGGSQRIGMFIGPFLGAGALQLAGTDGAYLLQIVAAGAAGGLLLGLRDVGAVASGNMQPVPSNVRTVVRDHLPVLRTLGIGVLVIGAVRASRQAVIPLWADHIGLEPAAASLVFGVANALDMLLFYPAGKVMDSYGRTWVAVPFLLTLGVAHLLMPLTSTTTTLTAVAVLMGVGNGMGSGIIMTLGADVAPQEGRPQFLGVWRLCSDSGSAAGPLLISGVTVLASLGPAIAVMGGVSLAGAWVIRRWIPPLSALARA